MEAVLYFSAISMASLIVNHPIQVILHNFRKLSNEEQPQITPMTQIF